MVTRNDLNSTAPSLPRPRRRQVRRKHVNRRPKYYWYNETNLRNELYEFWSQAGVNIPKSRLPPIPNEVVLLYFERHDLRGAIAKHGGRPSVSKLLGGAPIVPGRWQKATQESPETRAIIQADPNLSLDRPPSFRKVPRSRRSARNDDDDDDSSRNSDAPPPRWSHQIGRKPKGFWNLQAVVEELYEYVDQYREIHRRPSVWMPRSSEFTREGRDDLKQALNRYGGAKRICRLAGMVPYREWYYFEGQLELLLELRRYLDEHAEGNYTSFPAAQDIHRHGYSHLYSLIQYYGGRKFLAARLGMRCKKQFGHKNDMNWGPFDLDFAVRLLLFVRERHIEKNPPLPRNSCLSIPSQQYLLRSEEGKWLDAKIMEFGGYENVARRLGLALPF